MVLHSFLCSLYLSSLFRRSHASYTHSMNPRNKNKNKVNAVTLTEKLGVCTIANFYIYCGVQLTSKRDRARRRHPWKRQRIPNPWTSRLSDSSRVTEGRMREEVREEERVCIDHKNYGIVQRSILHSNHKGVVWQGLT